MEKKSKLKNAKIMRAARDQVEKLVNILLGLIRRSLKRPSVSQLSARAEMFEQARSELYAEMDPHYAAYMLIKIGIPGPRAERAAPRSIQQVMREIWMRFARCGWPWPNEERHYRFVTPMQ